MYVDMYIYMHMYTHACISMDYWLPQLFIVPYCSQSNGGSSIYAIVVVGDKYVTHYIYKQMIRSINNHMNSL